MKINDYVDLAVECGAYSTLGVRIADFENYSLSEIKVDSREKAELFGKPCGTYYSFLFSEADELCIEAIEEISTAIAEKLTGLLPTSEKLRIFVAGLGNEEIVFDSLGGRVCRKISPLVMEAFSLFPYEIGVEGKSGIESVSIVKSLVGEISADAVIVIDSLIARGEERLGRVIQISDSGINAASGVGRHKNALNYESIGVPVIAVGAPLALNLDGLLAVNEQVERTAETLSRIIADSILKLKPKVE